MYPMFLIRYVLLLLLLCFAARRIIAFSTFEIPIHISRRSHGSIEKKIATKSALCYHLQALPSLDETEVLTTDRLDEINITSKSLIEDGTTEVNLFFGAPAKTARSLLLFFLAQFVLFIGVGAVIPTIPLYGKEIGLSSAANGVVISAPALALLILAKPAGEYADRARKPAIILGMIIIALSDLGTALAQSIVPLLVARLGLGAGRCISESGERGMLADLAESIPDLRGRVLSIQQAVVALGIAIGAPGGGVVVETFGPRAAFLCVTVAAFVALFIYLFLEETIVNQSLSNRDNEITINQESASLQTIDWMELLQDAKWRGLSVFEIGTRFGYAAKLASIPILATAVLPGGAVGAGGLLSAAGLSGLIGAPLGGFLSDRIGPKNAVTVAGICSGLGLILIPISLLNELPIPTSAAFTASVLIWSMSAAAMTPASTAYAQELAPKGSTATAMALPRAAGDTVYLFAPFFLGIISDANVLDGTDCAIAGFFGIIGTVALNRLTK